MILDGFDLIGSSNTGALTFKKGHTIFFSPHLLPNDSNFLYLLLLKYMLLINLLVVLVNLIVLKKLLNLLTMKLGNK